MLAMLLQKIGRARQDKKLPAVAIVFVKSKHFLGANITDNQKSFFREYTTAIGLRDRKRAKKIILMLYKDNYQNKKSKAPIPYHAIDPAIL